MKTLKMMTMTGIVVLAIGLLVLPMNADAGMGRGGGAGKGGRGNLGMQTGGSGIIANLPYQELSEEERDGLIQMREEEKLARDVYLTLYETWNVGIFANISRAEQRHMDAVKILLDKYGIDDPMTDPAQGVFTSIEMQGLYDSLVEKGRQSLTDALYVGATIEDLDIKDLYDFLEQTDNSDIKTVYQNLAKGSRNHLRAFVSQLSANGVEYEAQYLPPVDVDEIVNSPHERGPVDENGQQIGGGRGQGQGQGFGRGMGKGGWQ
ncbi:DUF2202 domain-containing protein [Desulfococcaceae bacterium HSG9]|nr:DUF2202 domain-containing protein [Desulfococcaceae bacterium HSG9]